MRGVEASFDDGDARGGRGLRAERVEVRRPDLLDHVVLREQREPAVADERLDAGAQALEVGAPVIRDRVALLDVEAVLLGGARGRVVAFLVEPLLDPFAHRRQGGVAELRLEADVLRDEDLPLPLPDAALRRLDPGSDRGAGAEEQAVRLGLCAAKQSGRERPA